MNFAIVGSIITVLAVVAFAGIVAWTLSSHQDKRFKAAAQLPFDLPNEIPAVQSKAANPGECA